MGFLDSLKFSKRFSDDEDEYEDAKNEGEVYEDDAVIEAPAKPEPAAQQKSVRINTSVKLDGAALELKVVKPERYEVVPQIADHLLNRRTVVLNLEATNKETSRRIIDFLSGVAYAIDGKLSKVAINTYLITPANINVSGEALTEAKNAEQEDGEYSED